jgi:hypothetical protein
MRMLAVVAAGLVLGTAVFSGLVAAGVVPNPLAPRLEGDVALARTDRPGLRVLFVGNSMTFANGMPGLVHELAAGDAGAQPLFAVAYTRPNWTLEGAAADRRLEHLFAEIRWNVVVLQENSRVAALPRDRRRSESEPFAAALAARAANVGAETLFFMTSPESALELAAENGGSVAPVELAWREARRRRPALDLTAWDGHHPNRAGSYLIACVFYAVLSGREASGSVFAAGLPGDEARFLQRVADDVVASRDWGAS